MKRIQPIVALCGASFVPGSAFADTFIYTGSVQQFTVPTTGDLVAATAVPESDSLSLLALTLLGISGLRRLARRG